MVKDYTPEGYIRTTFYLKEYLKQSIKIEAERRSCTITEVINSIIEEGLEKE